MDKLYKRIGLIVIFLIALLNLWINFRDYGIDWLKATWRTRDLNAQQRSARFLIGEEGYHYIDFLNNALPESATLVVPEQSGPFSSQSILQFFLMPRRVTVCPCDDLDNPSRMQSCALCLNADNHYLLSIGDYPPIDIISQSKTLVEFPYASSTLHGFFAPNTKIQLLNLESALLAATQISHPVLKIILEGFLVLYLFLIGYSLIRCFFPGVSFIWVVLAGLPVGMGLSTFGIFCLGWIGFAFNNVLVITYFLGLGAATVWGMRRRQIPFIPQGRSVVQINEFRSWIRKPSNVIATSLLLITFLSVTIISIGRAYSTYDGIANWAVKGYAIAKFDTIFAGAEWGGHVLAYPQNIHLATAFFRSFTGDILPGSKLLHPLFYIITVMGVLTFLKNNTRSNFAAIGGSLLLSTVPFYFYHATTGFANVIFTGYVILAVFTLLTGLKQHAQDLLTLGGILTGLAAWTRPEGIFFGAVLLGTIFVLTKAYQVEKRNLAACIVAFLMISLTWQAFGLVHQAGDEIGIVIQGFIHNLRLADVDFDPLLQTLVFNLDHLLSSDLWGGVVYTSLSGILLTLLNRRIRRQRTILVMWLFTLILLLLPNSLFVINAYARGYTDQFMRVSFDRAMLPAIASLTTITVLVYDRVFTQPVDGILETARNKNP